MEKTEPRYATFENVVEFYGLKIQRNPETDEERSRVAQAKLLLVEGRLTETERTYWKSIIENGGRDTSPYKPSPQPKPQREKI